MKPITETRPLRKASSLNVVERVRAAITRNSDFWQNDLDSEVSYPHITEAIDERGIGDFVRMQVCTRNGFFKNYTPVTA